MRRAIATSAALLVVVAGGCARAERGALARPADGYRVVYRIEDRSGPRIGVSTEVVEIDRPFDTRVERRYLGATRRGQVTNREFFWELGDGAAPEFGLRRAPAGPNRDVSYASLDDAARAGAARRLGPGRSLGRRCTWFAYREPAPNDLKLPTKKSRVEVCVDPRGILLLEVWSIDGRAVRITQAESLRLGPPAKNRFLVGRDPTKERARRPDALRLLLSQFAVHDRADVDLPTGLRAPSGWKRDRRAVVSAAAGGGRATQFLVEAFVRGNELVVVERGARPELEPPWPPNEGARIGLGDLGSGRVMHYVDRVEVRLVGNVGFVRVAAPTRRIALEFVRGLRDRR